jgi:transcriptional regulator NrdR family protein
MIACPLCGRTTSVTETRPAGSGLLRRRKCTDLSCAGRVTTVEVTVDLLQRAADLAEGRAVIVPRKVIAQLQKLLTSLGVTS